MAQALKTEGGRHGAPTQRPRNRMQVFRDGFLYASPGADLTTCRHAAVLLLALDERGFELEVGARTRRQHAVVVRPCVAHRLLSPEAPFACLDMLAPHPQFRRFSRLADPGLRVLAPQRFAGVLPGLRAFQAGELDDAAARALYPLTLDLAAAALPDPGATDARVQRVLARLEHDPGCSIDALAEVACLSADRLSHLFSQEMGLPLRRHLQAIKLRAAARLYGEPMTLTEIAAAAGFCDSAHFSKVWMQAYGTPPGYYFTRKLTSIYPRPDTPRHRAA